MNIIIPAAGEGKRFLEQGYSSPKPLINVLGEPMIFYVIKSLCLQPSDKIFIVYTQDLDKYSFQHILRKEFPDLNLNFVLLKFKTRGPVETVLCGLNQMADLQEKTLVLDCDTFYGDDIVQSAKAVLGHCIFYFTDLSQDSIFSYIKIDNGQVMQIREKVRISDHACAGSYGFKSGTILKQYCESVLNAEDKAKGEYYLSSVYAQMLKDGETVIAYPVDDFHCLGTPYQLQAYCLNHEAGPKRFCFDLDGTLVTFPQKKGDYSTVRPILRNIKLVRHLHELGHTIIIQTARKMLTSHHNPGQAAKLAHESVFDTLEKFQIPFDEIYFGKPFAHFYVDDLSAKAFDIEKEIGFYDATIEPRSFNGVEYAAEYVVKKTSNPGEVYFYHHIPPSMKAHFPRVLETFYDTLKLERIQGIVFSYLLINHSLTQHNLTNLLRTVHELHRSWNLSDAPNIDYSANYIPKIAARYVEFDYRSLSPDSYHYYQKIVQKLDSHVPSIGVIHGDLVFSNIFLCDHQLIRFIDMRGRVGEVNTVFGDVFYDYAKIYQSLYGYDFILCDQEPNAVYLRELRECFEVSFLEMFSADKLETLKYITAGLLFSLIPLHTDPLKQKKYFDLIREIIP
jgi:capsule biosynthesis phosphatase